jgi:hypothetical protein
MIRTIQRIRHGDWYVQSKRCRDEHLGWTAWASTVPSDDIFTAPEPVYFDFGNTEEEVIQKLIDELDALPKETK